jgi:opacity protein-like surface antigen
MNHISSKRSLRSLLLGAFAVGLVICTSAPARAQGFISPMIGADFGGNAQCPNLSGCKANKTNVSVSFGAMGSVVGIEEEVAYAPSFFGTVPGLASSVFTLMTNVMLVPKIGPVRPYVEAGVGLVKTHAELTTASVFTTDNSSLGWDFGGGLMGLFGEHFGLRGDLRYFRAFKDLTVLGFALPDSKINYGRASVGVVLKF